MRELLSRPTAFVVGIALCLVALVTTALTAATSSASPDDDTHGLRLAQTQPVLVGSTTGHKSPTSRLARTPGGLRNLTGAKQIPVMIKYDYDAVASYTGTVTGYAATSPSVTGRALGRPSAATTRYLRYVTSQEQRISAAVRDAVPAVQITRSFRIVYGGVAALVPANSVRELLAVPGVVAVQRDALNQPLTDSSPDFINATAAYQTLGGRRNAGEGLLYGNLDTGLWPEHPSFADQGNLPAYTGAPLACEYGDNPTTPAADPFICNDKLVGGQAFLDTYDEIFGADSYDYAGTARDPDGHGTHTASTSAGNVVDDVATIGPVVPRINGIAPGAQVVEYRVCAPNGCYSSDSTAAVQQAVLDGVDVINFSISGGTDPLTDPVELAFLDAYSARVFVAASAGNDGPGASTANHLSPWVTTVAASTQAREFATTLRLTGSDGATFSVDGASLTAGAGPLPVVLASAPPYSSARCLEPAPTGVFAGKMVVCERGTNGRVEKGFNVLQGGAAAMVLYNPTLADVETDNHWLPTVHVADGTELLAFLAAHPGVTGEFAAGEPRTGRGDVMAAFSSRGPAGSFIKPDITAPGVQILAGMTPTPDSVTGGPPGNYYQAIAGTSMSSPHIAGAALLVAAARPAWTPGQIKSAMMTRARTSVVKEDLTTPADPFDMGAGRIDVGRAISAPLTISDTTAGFVALTGDPRHAIDLNLPSINAPTMPGRVTTTRRVRNITGHRLRVTAAASVPPHTRITFTPREFWLGPWATRSVRITLESTAGIGRQRFATVRFTTARGSLHLPTAFVRRQGSATLTQGCDRASVPRAGRTTCTVSATNNSFDAQGVDLTTSVDDHLRIVRAVGAAITSGRAHASAVLAGARLGVPSVDPGDSPAGYVPLADLDVDPIPIGDEELLTFDVPEFVYNGQPADVISIDSNGYLVVGEATSADNNCCDLPPGPSPNPPNNVLAPFWTDLTGEGAPGISAAVVDDDDPDTDDSWLVVQWEVNVFGTTDTRAFQTWIGVNGTQDISYTYESAQTDPNGQPYLVGAENPAGAGDMSAFLPSEDLRVTSTDPEPGDTISYRVIVKGVQVGRGVVHTEMRASEVPGVTTVNTRVRVTR